MNWKVGTFGAVLLTALAGAAFVCKHDEVSFGRLHEAKARLAALGYHIVSDSANGQISTGFLISRNAVAWNEAGTLCKSGRMGPEWRGKVWVTLNPEIWQLHTVPEEAGVRVWGAVVAFGDDELLQEIEAGL